MPEVNDWQLKFGYWWATNRERIMVLVRRTVFWLVLAVLVGVLLLAGRAFFYYLDAQSQATELTRSGLVTDSALNKVAQPLQAGNAVSRRLTNSRFDLLAAVVNPNDRWWAEVSYEFVSDGQSVGEQRTTIMPKQIKFFYQPSVKTTGQTVVLKINSTLWYKVKDQTRYPVDIVISGVTTEPVRTGALAGLTGTLTEFSLTNNSPYNYWSLPVQLVAKRGEAIVAAREVIVNNWAPNETKKLSVNWLLDLSGVSEITAQAVGNVFDDTIYRR